MVYVQRYDGLHLACLAPDQHARTCGYWYCISSHSTPHTAFRTRAALLRWLDDRGLSVERAIPAAGDHASMPIVGAYRKASHMSYDSFYAVEGLRTRLIDNARYTMAIISEDEDGLRTVHHLNHNCRDRPNYAHDESRALEDAGNPPAAARKLWEA